MDTITWSPLKRVKESAHKHFICGTLQQNWLPNVQMHNTINHYDMWITGSIDFALFRIFLFCVRIRHFRTKKKKKIF